MEICFLLFGGRHFYLMCLYDVVSSSVIKYVYLESSACEEQRAVKKSLWQSQLPLFQIPSFFIYLAKIKNINTNTLTTTTFYNKNCDKKGPNPWIAISEGPRAPSHHHAFFFCPIPRLHSLLNMLFKIFPGLHTEVQQAKTDDTHIFQEHGQNKRQA